MIRSFRDMETEKVFRRDFTRKFQAVALVAKRKLDHIHAAATLSDLGAIPGNRLEALTGDRKGQYSIRVNDQWRVCFRWVDADVLEVEIVDYHWSEFGLWRRKPRLCLPSIPVKHCVRIF